MLWEVLLVFVFCLVFCVHLVSVCIDVSFLSLGTFFHMISLKIWTMPLARGSSPSSVPNNLKFDLFMVSTFLIYYFPVFLNFSYFLLISSGSSILSLGPDSLSYL